MRRLLGGVLATVALSGCLTLPVSPLEDASQEIEGSWPGVVVAIIDTGINPWHEAFALHDSKEAPPAVGYERVPVSFKGELARRGPEAWNDLEPKRLYWFEGTRILAVSRLYHPPDSLLPEALFPPDPHIIFDDQGHGTAVASVVARTSPHTWILMVEGSELKQEAYAWVAEQPWIDVISSSTTNVAHFPNNITEADGYAAALRLAVDRGKLAVSAGGNEPDPNLLEGRNGPPWVISVGAADHEAKGPIPKTSHPVDVVARFDWDGLARAESDSETFASGGTSFGAPLVAGVLAESLYQLRLRSGSPAGSPGSALADAGGLRVTNADLRAALNLTARYWDSLEYKVVANTSRPGVPYPANPALPEIAGTPVGPWLQMGWGYVDEATGGDIVALLMGEAARPEKRDAAAYMERMYEIRAVFWDARQL